MSNPVETGWGARIWDALTDDEDQPIPTPEVDEPQPPAPITVTVVGSRDWAVPVIVHAVLATYASQHPDREIALVTSGADRGAEADAVEFAESRGWRVFREPDARLVLIGTDATFAFVKDDSKVRTLVDAIALSRPVHVFRDDVLRPSTQWEGR